MATFYQTERDDTYKVEASRNLLDEACKTATLKFRRVLSSYTLFHLSFLLLLLFQTVGFVFSLVLFPKSLIIALVLGSLVLTLFSYMIINYYFQGKKIDQFQDIAKGFFHTCQKEFKQLLTEEELHLSLGANAYELSSIIGQKQTYVLSLPPFEFFKEILIKARFLLHWKDILTMQELLMKRSVEEHVAAIRLQPIDLSIHSSLATILIAFSKIYLKPSDFPSSPIRFFPEEAMEEKFKKASLKAIEELLVLQQLMPEDPWTHAQLASCYHSLNLFEEELKEYETLSNLRPKDKEILLRLGHLYFKVGKNAKGLLIYETLRKIDARYGELVIQAYGMDDEFSGRLNS